MKASQLIKSELSQVYDFFGILGDCLGLTRAVLLIVHPQSGDLRPWCQKGFDETSLLKLRLSVSDLPPLPLDGSFLIDRPEKLALGNLFSTRDHENMGELLLLPIISHNKLLGLLIIADNPYFSSPTNELEMIMRPVQDLLRQIIEKHLGLTRPPVHIIEYSKIDYLKKHERSNTEGEVLLCLSISEMSKMIHLEYPQNLLPAIALDIKGRVLSFLYRQIDHVLVDANCCYLHLLPDLQTLTNEIRDMAADELVNSFGIDSQATAMGSFIKVLKYDTLWTNA